MKKLSNEHRRKISEGMKRVIASGKFFSAEHRRKLGEWQKGRPKSEEQKRKIAETLTGKCYLTEKGKETLRLKSTGRKHTEEVRKRISETHSGSNHYRWNPNREMIIRNADGRNDIEYKKWRYEVKKRDEFKCKINNEDCSGRLEVHHILGWSEHPELRYKINNGITLCHAHHPRMRAEEKRLILKFKELVSVSKV